MRHCGVQSRLGGQTDTHTDADDHNTFSAGYAAKVLKHIVNETFFISALEALGEHRIPLKMHYGSENGANSVLGFGSPPKSTRLVL